MYRPMGNFVLRNTSHYKLITGTNCTHYAKYHCIFFGNVVLGMLQCMHEKEKKINLCKIQRCGICVRKVQLRSRSEMPQHIKALLFFLTLYLYLLVVKREKAVKQDLFSSLRTH